MQGNGFDFVGQSALKCGIICERDQAFQRIDPLLRQAMQSPGIQGNDALTEAFAAVFCRHRSQFALRIGNNDRSRIVQ